MEEAVEIEEIEVIEDLEKVEKFEEVEVEDHRECMSSGAQLAVLNLFEGAIGRYSCVLTG